MAWEKINEIFPYGFAVTDAGKFSNEEIIENNFKELSLTVENPCHDIVKYLEKIVWYENGDLERYYIYHVFPRDMIDNKPLFNAFGQMVFTQYIKELKND